MGTQTAPPLPAEPTRATPVLASMQESPQPPQETPSALPSPGINIELHHDKEGSSPSPVEHSRSAQAGQLQFQSPIRQHKRTPSAHRHVKETLNARSEYTNDDSDGPYHYRINQYLIKQEIGRGSWGSVFLATDQYGREYAVKKFSKTRLRRRAQSNVLRMGPRELRSARVPARPGQGLFGGASDRLNDHRVNEAKDALFLIRHEVAIMKKLNHPNLVQLIEVLDDPEDDSLYMVLEMCEKGEIMKVGVGVQAKPYPPEQSRHFFRDLILGIEYLHGQGVVHRDIKPENLLLTRDDVLKIVDFGVSEMFEKSDAMMTDKSAGSPAFLPPELCVSHHGNVSGRAADIWSMGISLYCLRYGKIPFIRDSVPDMLQAIRTEQVQLPPGEDEDFVDLMNKILEKDPDKRITMDELREHPWVTKKGTDPLLSAEENCSEPVSPPNALELNHAFTRRMTNLIFVMKAISKFKSLLNKKGGPSRVSSPSEKTGAQSGGEPSTADYAARLLKERSEYLKFMNPEGRSTLSSSSSNTEAPLLGIGTGGRDDFVSDDPPQVDMVSDSPTATDFDVYGRAYRDEVEKIKRSSSKRGSRRGTGNLYLTKHLSQAEKEQGKKDESVSWVPDVKSVPNPKALLSEEGSEDHKTEEVSQATSGPTGSG
ncbi:hypothetical protein VTK73DRAFT_1870 [Phialemonium thermophilum]|uniref:Protein kinase domain-containing protein n=1 Tax=Phialemonium thermophilum TaxID=223376 RepID=A0ABR3X7C3_9PEZI